MCVAPPFATQTHTTTLFISPEIFQQKAKAPHFCGVFLQIQALF